MTNRTERELASLVARVVELEKGQRRYQRTASQALVSQHGGTLDIYDTDGTIRAQLGDDGSLVGYDETGAVRTSLADGTMTAFDAEGNARTVVGEQRDGTYTVTDVGGPPPPTPQTPLVESGPGSVSAIVLPGPEGGGDWPADFAGVEVHASIAGEDFDPNEGTQVAFDASTAGGRFTVTVQPGVDVWFRLVARTTSGEKSPPTDSAVVASMEFEFEPPPASDGNPPTSTPDPAVVGGIGALTIRFPELDNPDPAVIDVWVDTNPITFEGDPAYTVPADGPSLTFVRTVNGAPVTPNGTYYVRARSRDLDGNGPPSAQVTGSPAKVTAPDIAVDAITADMLVATNAFIEALEAVDLSAVTFTGPTFRTSAAGRRVVVRDDGSFGLIEAFSGFASETPSTITGYPNQGRPGIKVESGTTPNATDHGTLTLQSGSWADSGPAAFLGTNRAKVIIGQAIQIRSDIDGNGFGRSIQMFSGEDIELIVPTGRKVRVVSGTLDAVMDAGSVGTGSFRQSVESLITAAVANFLTQSQVDARVSAVAPTVTMTSGSVGTGNFRASVQALITAAVSSFLNQSQVDARVQAVAPGVTMAGGSVGTGAFRDSVDARVKTAGVTAYAKRQNLAATNLNNAAVTKVPFASSDRLDGLTWDSTNQRLVVVTPGRYAIKLLLTYVGNATGVRQARINVNGTNVIAVGSPPAGTTPVSATAAVDEVLAAGDYIDFYGYQTSGGALTLFNGAGANVATVSYMGPAAA